MSDSNRAPLNETPVRFSLAALAWRRAYYAARRRLRKRYPERYRKQGDPPTE